jgi:hypothetical protein
VYGSNAPFTSTMIEHLRSYATCSRRSVLFLPIHSPELESLPDFATFDVVTRHYSFFPGLQW